MDQDQPTPAEARPTARDLRDLDDRIGRTMDQQSAEGDDQLQRFWAMASRRARLGDIEVVMGTPWSEAMVPPAWSFGDSPEQADHLLALVLAGDKTATTSLRQEYEEEGEPLPKPGDLAILLDGASRPRALIREVEVVVTPFGQITDRQAAAEGEGDRTLDSWRQAHRDFWERGGRTVDEASPVVWERFKVLYQSPQG